MKHMGRGVQAMLKRMETPGLFTLTLALSLRERGGASRCVVKPGVRGGSEADGVTPLSQREREGVRESGYEVRDVSAGRTPVSK